MSERCECVACKASRLGMVSELDVLDRIAAAVAAEREAWREAAEASISHCRTDCTVESFCGQCEPLLAILTARGGKS